MLAGSEIFSLEMSKTEALTQAQGALRQSFGMRLVVELVGQCHCDMSRHCWYQVKKKHQSEEPGGLRDGRT